MPVEYPPTNYPPPTQCCEAHSQSLCQSFGNFYSLSPSPSPINGYISVIHSSHNAFRVVYGQSAHPTIIHSCKIERESLSQSFSVVFPPALSPSSIMFSVPAIHSTKPIQSYIPDSLFHIQF
ncbi:hypothetical protein T05_15917 [Trichinella murrelli]|uniref:Uncharacterized protein n=1 Tax=Trichinella murrelli TaxID=144512 RepID=A0A0V0T759_9BILA|nr:hypothetical protein T05_15917 [Trichinella murrelli]